MEFLNQSNLDYEAEIQRNPSMLRTWIDYINSSNSCSHEVGFNQIVIYINAFSVSNMAPQEMLGCVSQMLQDMELFPSGTG